MQPLDTLTIERVARLICDVDGPYERTGSQIERFLARVRWPDDPQYDGSPRVPWLTEVLVGYAHDSAAVDRLLCRLCDPIEYDGGLDTAEAIAGELNRVLGPERLSISYVGGRPVLGRVDQTKHRTLYGPPPELHSRVRRLAGNSEAVTILLTRADEASISQDNGAFALAIIGIGSFVEGLLHTVITERDATVRTSGLTQANGRRVAADRAGLALLLDHAHQQGWIQTDAKDFMEKVRDYRNFVHPRHQIQYGLVPDLDTVQLCWAPVHALMNDLESALLSTDQPARS